MATEDQQNTAAASATPPAPAVVDDGVAAARARLSAMIGKPLDPIKTEEDAAPVAPKPALTTTQTEREAERQGIMADPNYWKVGTPEQAALQKRMNQIIRAEGIEESNLKGEKLTDRDLADEARHRVGIKRSDVPHGLERVPEFDRLEHEGLGALADAGVSADVTRDLYSLVEERSFANRGEPLSDAQLDEIEHRFTGKLDAPTMKYLRAWYIKSVRSGR
jgi:hypothetical protein